MIFFEDFFGFFCGGWVKGTFFCRHFFCNGKSFLGGIFFEALGLILGAEGLSDCWFFWRGDFFAFFGEGPIFVGGRKCYSDVLHKNL